MEWNYTQPVDIVFGNGRIKELPSLILEGGGEKGILVTDPFFMNNGLAKKIIEMSEGKLSAVFSDVSPNPDVSEVDACAEIIRKEGIDFAVVLGGGSAMDCAKAAASVALTNESIKVFHGTGVPIPEEHLPLIAIPTTSGTGSEVTCVSVLTDHSNGKKSPIVSKGFYPVYALIDPVLTHSMPAHVTAGTGIDVLCHAIEGYWSRYHQPVCSALAIHAIELVFKYLPRACKEPTDKEAREKMSEASVIAGLAFTLPKTTASHACSFPLTNILKIPHGEACGLTIDWFLRINGQSDKRVQDLAEKLGYKSTDAMADSILVLKKAVGLRTDLADLELNNEQVEELVKISRHPNLYNNPVDISDEMLYDMYNSFRMAVVV
jgi:alcohol dehydrogenase